jgi:hypothetical protein
MSAEELPDSRMSNSIDPIRWEELGEPLTKP